MADRQASLSSGGPRIAVFGLPEAGKSSLLGALAHVAETHADALGARIKGADGLADLKRHLHAGDDLAADREATSYSIALQPQAPGMPATATLIDCDSRSAEVRDGNEAQLTDAPPAVQDAHALLLVVDASARPEQLKKDFAQCTEFLRDLEQRRAQDFAVAGLPVFLVLTKCDLLAKSDDTPGRWLERIEEGKRKISQRFKEFLADEENRTGQAFGRIDLHVWATAIKRPELVDKPAREEPLGVAELFRFALSAGHAFQDREGRADRRLKLAVSGVVAVLALLVCGAAVFFLVRPPSEVAALENAARNILPGDTSTADERLKALEEKIKQYERIVGDPYFAKLDPIMQHKIRTARAELVLYRDLSEKFKLNNLPPEEFAREDNLKTLRAFLDSFSLPEEYEEQWKNTELFRNLEKRRKQVKLYRQVIDKTEQLLEERIKAGKELLMTYPSPKDPIAKLEEWKTKVRAFLSLPLPNPADEVEVLPDVTYKRVYEFRRVRELRDNLVALHETLSAKAK